MKKFFSFLLCLILLCATLPAFALTYEELLQKAEEYIESGDYGKAFACYDMAIKNEPEKPDAMIAEGNLYLQTGRYPEAYASAESALSLDSTIQEGWLLRCRIDIAIGDTEAFESDSLYAEICGVDLTQYSAAIGRMYASSGQNEKALSYFTNLPVDSLDESLKKIYAQVLISTGNRDKAVELGLGTDIRNEKLNAAFEADSLRLVETTLPMCYPSVDDFELSEELLKNLKQLYGVEDPAAEFKDSYSLERLQLLSVSPSGESALFIYAGSGVSMYHGKYHVLYPAYEKSVEDTYGNLKTYSEKYILRFFTNMIGNEGIVYSPDGKYAAVYNIDFVRKGHYIIDPIIIDLSTGEMKLTATYPNKIVTEENAGTVTTACFSADGKSFYYTLYGRFGDQRIRMCRYDLVTETTETLLESEICAWRPHLSQTTNGNLLAVIDSPYETGLGYTEYKDGSWILSQKTPDVDYHLFKVTDLRYSANSGYAVLAGSLTSGYCYAFQLLKPDEDLKGFDQYLSLTTGTNEIVAASAEEYQKTIMEHLTGIVEGAETRLNAPNLEYPYQQIQHVILSPDGHYVLLNTISNSREGRSRDLFLVRLDDLAVRKITGLDAGSIPVGPLGKPYDINIEWNTDDLIIGTDDGIKTFRFALP